MASVPTTPAGDPADDSPPRPSSLDSQLKHLAAGVGNIFSQAKTAIERRVTEAVAMFPLIDLSEEPLPESTASWYDQPPKANVMATLQHRSCPSCTYAGTPLSSSHCAVCHSSLQTSGSNAAGWNQGKANSPPKPRSCIYPSLSSTDEGDGDVIIIPTGPQVQRKIVETLDPSTWMCPKCTLRNPYTEKCCAACGSVSSNNGGPPTENGRAPRERNQLIQRRTSTNECWPCSSCTFFNPQSGNVCLMCSKPKLNTEGGTFSQEKFQAEDVQELRKFHEQESVQQWAGIISFCSKDGNPFVDDRFPPLQSSLVVGKSPPEFHKVQGWLRPSQLRGQSRVGWTVCRTPMASDINQGILGDCWFLCSLSVVAERPSLIDNVIMTRDYNREGAYLIRLCVDGLWKVILVDDLFPVDGHGNLAFSKAGRNQLWVPLIEKALAKAHASYFSIEGGFVNEGLMFLTGAPCDRISLEAVNADSFDSIWGQLLSCHSSGFLMGASCGKPNESLNEQECLRWGLRPRHSYSVLDVQDVDGNRLIRLRDPWGRQAWKGDWNERSKTWTPVLRQIVMPQGGSEGLFWISLPDFLKYFDCVDISKYREHWKEIRVQGAFPNNSLSRNWSVWNLSVTETTEVDFTLYQQGYRGSSNDANAHHLDLLILVLACGPDRRISKLVDASKRTTFSFVGTSCLLDPGNYIIWTLAFNHWNDMMLPSETFPKNVIAFHSGKPVAVEKLLPPPFALADAVIYWTMQKGTKSNDREGVTSYSVMHGGLVLVYENRYPTRGVQLVCDCTQSRDVVSSRGVLYFMDFIPPLTRMVICVLSPSHGSAFYIHFSTKQRLCHAWEGLGDWGPAGTLHLPEVDTDLVRDLHIPRPLF